MKVVYLLTFLDSQTGGMERQALQIAKKLHSRGCNIFFITCAHISVMRQARLKLADTKDGFPVYRIPLVKNTRWLNKFIYGIGALALLIVFSKRYNLIHAHQLYTSGLIASIAKCFLRSKKLIVKNCCGGEFGDVKFLKQLPLASLFLKCMRKNVDQYIAISAETEQEMESARLGPISDIPNGVDTDFFKPATNAEKIARRKEFNIPSADSIILFVGRFNHQKNISVLISAMRHIQAPARLLIVGDGSLRASLEQYAAECQLKEKVLFCGITQEIKKYYQLADVFVLPSRAEGMANVLLEAMSSGLPCVGSDIASIRALIEHGVNGYLVPIDNVSALAQALDQLLLAKTTLSRGFGENARARVERNFSLDSVARNYAILYKTLI